MYSKNNKPVVGKFLKRAISGPLAFATAGAARETQVQQDLHGRQETRVNLDFQFPRPREQSFQDLLDSANYMSAAKKSKGKKTAIKEATNISKVNLKLVQAIFKGESGDNLTKKIVGCR